VLLTIVAVLCWVIARGGEGRGAGGVGRAAGRGRRATPQPSRVCLLLDKRTKANNKMTTTPTTDETMAMQLRASSMGPASAAEAWETVKTRRRSQHVRRAPSPTPSSASTGSARSCRSARSSSAHSNSSRATVASTASTRKGGVGRPRPEATLPGVTTKNVNDEISGVVASVEVDVAWIDCGLAKQGRLHARQATKEGGYVRDLREHLSKGDRLEHLTVLRVDPPRFRGDRGRLELTAKTAAAPPQQRRRPLQEQPERQLAKQRESLECPTGTRREVPGAELASRWDPPAHQRPRAHEPATEVRRAGKPALLDFLVVKPAKARDEKKERAAKEEQAAPPKASRPMPTPAAPTPVRLADHKEPVGPWAAAVLVGEETPAAAPPPPPKVLLTRKVNGRVLRLRDLPWKQFPLTALVA
jgi:predicted RNA-binding protein with RPS1 domain